MKITDIIDILNKIKEYYQKLDQDSKWQIVKCSKKTLKNLNEVPVSMFKVAINTILNYSHKENINNILSFLKQEQPFPNIIDEFLNKNILPNDIMYIRESLFLFRRITTFEKTKMLYNILTNQKLMYQGEEYNNKALVLATSFVYDERENIQELTYLQEIINDEFFDYYNLNTYFIDIIEDNDDQNTSYSKLKIKDFLYDNSKLKELIIHLYNIDSFKEDKLNYYNFLINTLRKCKINLEIIPINSDIDINKDNYCNYLFSLLIYYTKIDTEELHEINVRKLEIS